MCQDGGISSGIAIDDLELVEVSVPAEMGTEPCEPA
jgi:hypothetical protein